VGDNTRLPAEFADRFTKPFQQFLRIEAAAGALLLLATLIALALSNSVLGSRFLDFWETPIGLTFGPWDFTRSLRHWINDGVMTLFFFVVALELKRELVLGELRSFQLAALSLAGALGGMIVPAGIFLLLMDSQSGAHGWGVVMATDTAFVIGCLALFGRRIPPSLRLFLLSLAIFDDVGAIMVVAIGYGDALSWRALSLAGVGLAAVAAAARIGVRAVPFYFLLGGVIWLCVDGSGIHPTIVGVILGLMTPTRGWVNDARLRTILGGVLSYPEGEHWSGDTADRRALKRAGTAVKETLSPLERLELGLHPWVGFVIVPMFALANAGVFLSSAAWDQPVVLAIVAGLVLGKPLGVVAFSWIVVRFGLATRPPTLSWPYLIAGALLTGIGFTMSLLIAGLAFAPSMLSAAKMGILIASLLSAVGGAGMLVVLTRRGANEVSS
jgi:NhaA family Na+:H+ antiporter